MATNVSAGVAILFSTHLNVNILSEMEIEKGRILMVKVKIDNQLFVFINIYTPNKGSDRILMFRKLGEFLKSHTLDGVLIVGGDWNCTLNFLLDRNNEEPHPPSASFLKSIIIQNDLVDVWRDKNKEMKQYTWTKVSQEMISVARLDRSMSSVLKIIEYGVSYFSMLSIGSPFYYSHIVLTQI